MYAHLQGNVIYVVTLSNHSKFHNFVTSWTMIKNITKLCKKVHSHKINKNTKKGGEISASDFV